LRGSLGFAINWMDALGADACRWSRVRCEIPGIALG